MSFYAVQLCDGFEYDVELMPEGHAWKAKVDGEDYQLRLVGTCPRRGLVIELDGQRVYLPWDKREANTFQSIIKDVSVHLPQQQTKKPSICCGDDEHLSLPSPISGVLIDILVDAGEEVEEGDPIMVLEAMKMENVIYAPCAGKVKCFSMEIGKEVRKGVTLAVFKPSRESDLSMPSFSSLQALSFASAA